MLTFAFQMPETDSPLWQGGVSLFENLIGALKLTHAHDSACWLAARQDAPAPAPALTAQTKGVIRYPNFTPRSRAWAIEYGKRVLLKSAMTADRILRAQQVDVLFCNAPLRRTSLPSMALVPDLQHLRLPDFFSQADCAARHAMFLRTIERATRIIVISQAVRADVEQLAPAARDKIRVLPPEPVIPPEIYTTDPRYVLEKYHLPKKFFYLPNQLWRHKNHQLVLAALAQCKKQARNINVVCTGAIGDYRHAELASEILETVARLGLHAQFILLGKIPRADVFALHRQSICVLNPSLFEGYGMSIAEARAIGKRVLASDLAAHRELDAPVAAYVDPHDADALANALIEIWETSAPGPALELEQAARLAQAERVRAVGHALYQAAAEIA